jgi:hypothetical protein
MGDDGASGVVQFRREFGAGGPGANDGDVQLARMDRSALGLRADTR